jgi:hypothetical protein
MVVFIDFHRRGEMGLRREGCRISKAFDSWNLYKETGFEGISDP